MSYDKREWWWQNERLLAGAGPYRARWRAWLCRPIGRGWYLGWA